MSQGSIFEGVQYYISPSISPDIAGKLADLLDEQRGIPKALPKATHVITDSDRFEGWPSISEDIQVVTPLWVERSVVLDRAQPAEWYSTDPTKIFSGVIGCPSDLPETDIEVISGALTALGGQWRTGYTRDVTHLFALVPSGDRYATAIYHQPHTRVHILVPHWFDDSMLFGRALPTEEYSWPEPTVLNRREDANAMRMKARDERLSNDRRSLFQTATMEEPLSKPQVTKNVWQSRKVLFSTLLQLSPARRDALEATIARSGGHMLCYRKAEGLGTVEEELALVEEADVFITQYRWGRAFVEACRTNKTIGTLAWMFHVEATGAITIPTEEALHFPVPRQPIAGFETHEITVTNYTGDAREYLKKLIQTMGAVFTPSMSAKNTIVIAAYKTGTKTDKAISWGLPIVNHLWLEDCFAQWRALTPAQHKYIDFPPSFDFSRVLGERRAARITIQEPELEEIEHQARMTDRLEGSEEDEDIAAQKPMDIDVQITPIRMRHDPSRSPSKYSARKKRREAAADAADTSEFVEQELILDDDDALTKPEPKRVRQAGIPKATSSAAEIEDILSHVTDGDEDPPAKPRSRHTKRRGSTESADVFVVPAKSSSPKKGKPKSARKSSPIPDLTDSDDELDLPTRFLPGPSKTTGPIAKATQALKTPTKRTSSVVTVEVPTLASLKKSPLKKGASIRVAARETHSTPASAVKRKNGVAHIQEEGESEEEEMPAATLTRLKGSAKELPKEASTPPRSPSPKPKRKTKGKPAIPPIESSVAETTSEAHYKTQDSAETMSARPRRGAAVRADKKLKNDVMPDLVNYERDRRRGVVRGAWEKGGTGLKVTPRGTTEETESYQPPPRGTKRDSTGAEEEDEEEKVVKKRRKTAKGGRKGKDVESEEDENAQDGDEFRESSERKDVRLCTTQVDLTKDQTEVLYTLGVKIVEKAEDCTHLAARKLMRTEKLLCAMPTAQFVLSQDWVFDSIKRKALQPEEKYTLRDPVQEKTYAFTIAAALERAKDNGGRLFDGHTFYITPKISTEVDAKLLKTVITASGGNVASGNPTHRILSSSENRYVISCNADKAIWEPLLRQGHPIYSKELILTSALTQELDLKERRFRLEAAKYA